jgi:hypothetical protein
VERYAQEAIREAEEVFVKAYIRSALEKGPNKRLRNNRT